MGLPIEDLHQGQLTAFCQSVMLLPMARKKTTVYLDEDLLTATKVLAVTMGRPEHEVVEEALRHYLRQTRARLAWRQLDALLNALGESSIMSDEDSTAFATAAVHEVRAEKRAAVPKSDPASLPEHAVGESR